MHNNDLNELDASNNVEKDILCNKCHNGIICKACDQINILYNMGIDVNVESCLYFGARNK